MVAKQGFKFGLRKKMIDKVVNICICYQIKINFVSRGFYIHIKQSAVNNRISRRCKHLIFCLFFLHEFVSFFCKSKKFSDYFAFLLFIVTIAKFF